MEKILFLAHTEADGSLGKLSLEALNRSVTLAESLAGAELIVGLVGSDVSRAAEQIGSSGAVKFLSVSGQEFSQPRYASDRTAAEALIRAADPSLIIAPSTSRWSRSLSGACLRVGARVDTHVSEVFVDGGDIVVKRWFYRQRMEGELSRSSRPWCLLVDSGSVPWSGPSALVSLQQVPVEFNEAACKTKLKGYEEPISGEQTIRPDSELLFVAGAGWTKKQADGQAHTAKAAELILSFTKRAGASLGSSKSLVDMDAEGQGVLPFLSHMNQVGQTGSSPRHPKGLATCCHGEEPHVVGWRFINERRAINLDANCGWAQGKADVLYVADAFSVMEKVNALLASGPR